MGISHETVNMDAYMYTHCESMPGRLTDLLCLYLYGLFAGVANLLAVTVQSGTG